MLKNKITKKLNNSYKFEIWQLDQGMSHISVLIATVHILEATDKN